MDTPHLEELYFLELDGCKYEGIAFDGCYFYLTAQDTICVFDLSMKKLHQIKTCQRFTSICYDPCFDCFWALSASRSQYAYRLNRMLSEIDRIELPYQYGKPSGISCSEDDNELLIATGENLYSISKSGGMSMCKIKYRHKTMSVCVCACAASKGCLCYGILGDANTVRQFNPCGMSCGIILPEGYILVDMSCGRCDHEAFFLAIKDNCYYRIIRCYEDTCKCFAPREESCCDSCCEPCVESYCDPCQEEYCDESCPQPCHEEEYDESCNEDLDVCCDDCENLCCDLCSNKHRNPCKEQGLSDIIESIALIEAALSHILNAEGEKLQKILEISDEPEVLLETNKSISSTISKVTHLEYVLFEKLKMVQELSECQEEEPKDCKPHYC